jgi:hypothetical protein
MAIELTRTDFIAVYPEYREVTDAMFTHARGLADIEVPESYYGQQKGRAALIELIAEQLGPVPGPNETTPRIGGSNPHRARFERIRSSLGPFMDLV